MINQRDFFANITLNFVDKATDEFLVPCRNKDISRLKRKIHNFLRQEGVYWKIIQEQRDIIENYNDEYTQHFDEFYAPYQKKFIQACRDGAVMQRHRVEKGEEGISVNYWKCSVSQFLNPLHLQSSETNFFIPPCSSHVGSQIAVKKLIIGREEKPQYTWHDFRLTSFWYDSSDHMLEDAIKDVQWAIIEIGSKIALSSTTNDSSANIDPINRMKVLKDRFELLLNNAKKEEELQIFLKSNPIFLGPHTIKIDKAKLGEDFITDFVLVNTLDQGVKYTMVEIEKVTMPLFRKSTSNKNEFSSEFNHAYSQILDWEVWLESNKAYFQNKHEGFETPNYLIIAGRSTELSDEQKAILRVWNRQQKNVQFLTYDDILVRFNEHIELLQNS